VTHPEQVALAQPEDAHTRAEWEREAAAVLRKSKRLQDDDPDAAVWEKLTRRTLDGIGIPPLGLPDAPAGGLRPTRVGGWDIRSHFSGSSAAAVNEEALAELEGGATSLWLDLSAEGSADDLAAVLEGVLLDLAPVVLDAPTQAVAAAEAYLAVLEKNGSTAAAGSSLGADPLGALLRGLPLAPDEAFDELRTLTDLAREHDLGAVVVDATAAHDLGASDAQELGWSIAAGVAYLRALTDQGLSVDDAARLVDFRYAATDEQFPTIAKLRAARRLWARVLEISGANDVVQHQHAVTSRPMLSKYDPHVNMLRTTVAAFAAGVGGADAVTVLPFDSANGRSEEFPRRIARNVSHLLLDESHVGVVVDPAGGAYAVEQLTDDLAEAGWAEFQRLEAEWESGHDFDPFRERIAAVVAERDRQIATRRRPLTGLSEFPLADERPLVREPDPLADRAPRYGAAFEALRDQPAEKHVFVATLGTVAQHTARATFATNLLAAGGIAVDVAGATSGIDDLVAAYAGQPVVVLAGSDALYAERGEAAAQALRAAGARRIVVAGKPLAGCDDNVAMGDDAVAFLTRTKEALA